MKQIVVTSTSFNIKAELFFKNRLCLLSQFYAFIGTLFAFSSQAIVQYIACKLKSFKHIRYSIL